MARKRRKSRRSRKEARSRQEGWRRWLPTAALVLAVVLIGAGLVWFSNRRGNAGPTVSEATNAELAGVARVTAQELKAKMDAGQAVAFDARRQVDYARKHISGALSLPQDEVAARLPELPTDKLAVFYCT